MEKGRLIQIILFEWEKLSFDELKRMVGSFANDFKILRWLARIHPDNKIRNWLLILSNVEVGKDVVINPGIMIFDDYEPLVEIGDRCAIADNVTIVASSSCNNSTLKEISYVKDKLVKKSFVAIGPDCWLGSRSILLPGVKLGRGVIVGAGAIVNKSFTDYQIIAGVPATPVRKLFTRVNK